MFGEFITISDTYTTVMFQEKCRRCFLFLKKDNFFIFLYPLIPLRGELDGNAERGGEDAQLKLLHIKLCAL